MKAALILMLGVWLFVANYVILYVNAPDAATEAAKQRQLQQLIKDTTCPSVFGLQYDTNLCLSYSFPYGSHVICKQECNNLNKLHAGFIADGTCKREVGWMTVYQCHCHLQKVSGSHTAKSPEQLLFSDAFAQARHTFNSNNEKAAEALISEMAETKDRNEITTKAKSELGLQYKQEKHEEGMKILENARKLLEEETKEQDKELERLRKVHTSNEALINQLTKDIEEVTAIKEHMKPYNDRVMAAATELMNGLAASQAQYTSLHKS